MTDNEFFEESREQSQVKARIVAKYFWPWAKVMIHSVKANGVGRIAYIDLFAGPGRYEDGTLSTPLMILQQAVGDPDMCNMLVSVLNDCDSENIGKLKAAIEALPGVDKLKYKPQISTRTVDETLPEVLAALKLVPTFFFVDPWGYKGLSLGLINSVLQNWGSDCIFFFNYNRVNMGLNNNAVRKHMDVLFGVDRANKLRAALPGRDPTGREALILKALSDSLKEMGGSFVLPFSFKDDEGVRTRHYLIFVTKDFKGYDIMKEIMAKESSTHVQGVPSFEFSPPKEIYQMLFEMSHPLDDLVDMLLTHFAGEALTMREIYERHSVDRNYIERNYKQALIALEAKGAIKTDPPASARRKVKGQVTFADHVRVRFPRNNK